MIKMMAAIRRKPGMTHQEYCDYVRDVHGALTKANPLGVKRYVQNHVFDSAFGAETDSLYHQVFHRDSVTELWFENWTTLGQTFANRYVQEVIAPDGAKFSDMEVAINLMTCELPFDVPHPGEGSVKVLHFIKKPDSLEPDEFLERWTSAHAGVLANQPSFAAALRKYVQNRPIEAPGGRQTKHFGGEGMPTYDGIGCMWFDGQQGLQEFRSYQRKLEALGGNAHFIDSSRSFFLYAREVVIIAG